MNAHAGPEAQVTSDQLDAVREMVNIGIGRAAASLSDMVQQRVELDVPRLRTVLPDEPPPLDLMPDPGASGLLAVVEQSFSGRLTGSAMLLVPEAAAAALVSLLTQGLLAPDELETEAAAVITEVGNVLINGVVGTLANLVGAGVAFDLPVFSSERPDALLAQFVDRASALILIEVEFRIAQNAISGRMALIFEVGALAYLLERIQTMLDGGDLSA